MTARRISAIAALAALLTACGVPGTTSFTGIENEDIPYGLGEPTTTAPPSTSTTSTTVVSSTAPESAPSTVPTEPVTVYFLAGRQLISIELALVRPASLPQVVAALEQGPPGGPSTPGLRSALRDDAIVGVTEEGGVATVDLAPGLFDDLAPPEQRLAIAQIVLTLTRQRGIGQVRFTQSGAAISVPMGSGMFTAPGQAVTHVDYELLLSETPPPLTNTTTSTSTPTTTTAPPVASGDTTTTSTTSQ